MSTQNRVHVAILAMIAVLSVVLLAADAFAGGTVYGVKDCSKPRVKPSRIIATCADGGFYFTAKHWTYWNGREAGAKGKVHANDCDPSCLGGTYHKFKARIRLSKVRVRTCNGRRLPMFQKATVRIVGNKPDWIERTRKFPLTCFNP